MISMKYFILCLGLVAVSLQTVYCFDDADIQKLKELFEPILAECGPKFGVTKETLEAARETKDLSAIENCFFACAFKHIHFINDKGMYDKDTAIAEAKKNFGKDAAAFEKINEKCASVNDASVSDGDAGCERAKLLVECFHENKDLLKN